MDCPLLGGERVADGVLGWKVRLGRPFPDFCASVGDVDYDAGEPDAGRKRFCGVCVQGIFGRVFAECRRGDSHGDALAFDYLLPVFVCRGVDCPALVGKAFRQEAGIGKGKCNIKMGR